MDSEIGSEEQEVETLFVAEEEVSSGEEPPMSEWSSLTQMYTFKADDTKRTLYERGLYSPGSGDICNKYIPQSDSTVLRHLYYSYPALTDPGIKEALLSPELPVMYPDDGQKLYLQLCSDMTLCPVRTFYKNLLGTEINLSYYGVNPKGVRAMAMALQFNKTVTLFDLTDNFLTDDSCYHLGQMLKSNAKLKELILAGCRIGASGLLRLGASLNENRTLQTLNLARNNIGENGGVVFGKQIFNGLSVKNVNLSNNGLAREAAVAILEGMECRNPFTKLDLSWNNFYHIPTTAKLLDQIAQSDVLQELNLSFSSLEGERIASSIKSILKIPTLTALDLSHNRFREEAITIITAGLISAKKLVTFNLSDNPMTPQNAYDTLEKMLKPRVKVRKLLMENVSVEKSFLGLLERVQKLKFRKNFEITYGDVLQNWTVKGPDPRNVILKRADYLGTANKKNRVDIALYFLALNKEMNKPIAIKDLTDRLDADNVPLTESVVEQFCCVFPGPKTKKARTIDLQAICEYIARVWPEKKLPPTPPPELQSIPPPPPPTDKKAKGKK